MPLPAGYHEPDLTIWLKAAIQVVEIVSRYVEKMAEEIESTLQSSKVEYF